VSHGDDLVQNPIAETFFELRWQLRGGPPPAPTMDPGYKLLVGSLFSKVRDAGYEFHEQLPTAQIPDEIVPYLIQHRFRVAAGAHPLVQVGPGVFAINETGPHYSWVTFLPRIIKAIEMLRDVYSEELVPVSYELRYVNAVPLDPATQNVFEFLSRKLKVAITYPQSLFADDRVSPSQDVVLLESIHQSRDPEAVVSLKFSTGAVSGTKSLLWEIAVRSIGDRAPSLDGLESWLDRAHDLERAWFFTLIEGELEAEFNA